MPELEALGHRPVALTLPGQGDGAASATLDDQVAATVADAMEYAASSPPPPASTLLDNVFADRSALPARSAQWRSES